MAVVWTAAEDAWLSPFEQAEQEGRAAVERIPPRLAITRLPRGFQGLLGDPPRRGWSYVVRCTDGKSRYEERFTTPLVYETNYLAVFEPRYPCVFHWSARAVRPIASAVLRTLAEGGEETWFGRS